MAHPTPAWVAKPGVDCFQVGRPLCFHRLGDARVSPGLAVQVRAHSPVRSERRTGLAGPERVALELVVLELVVRGQAVPGLAVLAEPEWWHQGGVGRAPDLGDRGWVLA